MLFLLHTLRLQIQRRSYSYWPKRKGSKWPNNIFKFSQPNLQVPLSTVKPEISQKLQPSIEKPAPVKKLPSELPKITYLSEPSYKLFYTQDTKIANELLGRLNGNVLGMDMEWRAIFKPGQQSKTALIQLCDDETILLLQVCRMKQFPEKLRLILEDRDIIKTGLNIQGDALKLTRDYGILVNGLAELGYAARRVGEGWKNVGMPSLQECVAILIGKYLAKGSVRTSNWELNLTRKQIEYAATDAYASYKLYRRIECLWPEPGPIVKLVHMTDEVVNKEKVTQPKAKQPKVEQPKVSLRPSATPAVLRAYNLWYKGLSIAEIGALCRTPENPLKGTTVVSYVLKAIQVEGVPYDREKLRAVIERENYGRFYKAHFAKYVPL